MNVGHAAPMRHRCRRRWTLAMAAVANVLPAAGAAVAQGAGEMRLDAVFLAAPTDWCPAAEGVPMVMTMDGPDIIKGPENATKTVRERRGGTVNLVQTGENIASFNRQDEFAGPNAEVIGRFSAEFRICHGPFSVPMASGTWQLAKSDGSGTESGEFEDEVLSQMFTPFFRGVAGPSGAMYAQFGDRKFFALARPATTTTQMFLAKPDKE